MIFQTLSEEIAEMFETDCPSVYWYDHTINPNPVRVRIPKKFRNRKVLLPKEPPVRPLQKCAHCPVLFSPKDAREKAHSARCRNAAAVRSYREAMRAKRVAIECACLHCGAPFVIPPGAEGGLARKRFCRRVCRDRYLFVDYQKVTEELEQLDLTSCVRPNA